jgi:diguanylate cyclase (GGDEF)-like protein
VTVFSMEDAVRRSNPRSLGYRQPGREVQVVNDFYNLTTRAHPGPHAGRSSVLGAPPAGLNEHARMARWPGPGLLSPLGSPRGARNGIQEEPEFPDEVDGALGELPSLLARSASGLEFIYKTLDLIAARYRLRDLVVVVTRPDKPHVFRLGRAPLAIEQGPLPAYLGLALSGHEGLYADPPIVGPVASACVISLVELALRLDLLMHDASHDSLTGLLNRRSYELLLGQAVSRARRYGWPFALVLLDLDNFKVVNDRYGHAAGDMALQTVGAELRASLRSGDVAARLGGDEFALLVVGVDNGVALSPLLGRLKRALERSVPQTDVSFSVGVACFPSDTDDPNALTGLADARLYAAKSAMEYR